MLGWEGSPLLCERNEGLRLVPATTFAPSQRQPDIARVYTWHRSGTQLGGGSAVML